MIDLDEIEKAAEAATPVDGLNWSFVRTTFGDYFYATKKESNYIDTMNPTVALALVKELKALRKVAAAAERVCEAYGQDLWDELNLTIKELRREPCKGIEVPE